MATIAKRRLADGSTRYQAVIRRAGQAKKRQFRTRSAAVKWATKTEAAVIDGAELPGIAEERRTVDEVLAAYLASGVLDALRSPAPRRQHLAWWRARLGAVKLRQLDRAKIREGLQALERGETPTGRPAAPATRRRYLATLRAAFTWAIDEGLARENPAAGAARKGRDVEPPGRVRVLDDQERTRLLAECDRHPRLGPLARLALLTGCREGELLALRWGDVDLERGVLSLRRAKAGKRSVAASTAAVAILRALRERRVVGWPLVFAARPYGKATFPRPAWNRAVAAAGLSDFNFHDLRHCYASALLTAGGTLPELAAALGHRTMAMVMRYSHLERPHAATIAERVAERLG